jgi:GTPase SAR1 family protein
MEVLSEYPISDETEDAFDLEPLIENLGKAIDEPKSPPNTVGIFGEMGSGKTSLMHLLCNWLTDNGYKTIWFDPWRYKRKEELWSALIREILLKIYHTTNDNALKKMVWNLLKSIGWPTFDESLLAISGGFALPSKNVASEPKFVYSPIEQRFFTRLQASFLTAVQDYISRKGKLIIFIDDFDNNVPESALSILEFLKSHCIAKHSVFIFGMDETMIEPEVTKRFNSVDKPSTRDFIKEQIEHPFFLPPIQFNKIQNYIQTEPWSSEITPMVWKLLRYGLHGNPREITQFINYYFMIKAKLQYPEIALELGLRVDKVDRIVYNDSINEKLFLISKLFVIKQFYPKFYEYLHKNPLGWYRYEKVIKAKRQFKLDEQKRPKVKSKELSKEQLLKKYTDLTEFWHNRHFRMLMQQTCGEGFPRAPTSAILNKLLRFIDSMERWLI